MRTSRQHLAAPCTNVYCGISIRSEREGSTAREGSECLRRKFDFLSSNCGSLTMGSLAMGCVAMGCVAMGCVAMGCRCLLYSCFGSAFSTLTAVTALTGLPHALHSTCCTYFCIRQRRGKSRRQARLGRLEPLVAPLVEQYSSRVWDARRGKIARLKKMWQPGLSSRTE